MLTRIEQELIMDKTKASDECCKNTPQIDKNHYSDKNHIKHCCGKHQHDHQNGCKRRGEQD